MNTVMIRHADDEFEAFLIADAMASCGLRIVSVTPVRNQLVVFSQGDEPIDTNEVDRKIVERKGIQG